MRKMLWLSGTCSKRIADSLLYACANPIHILSAAFAIQQKTLNDLCHQPQALVGNASRAYSDRKQSPAYSFCAPRYNSCLHSLRVVTSWLHQKRERTYRWTRTTIIHIYERLWEYVMCFCLQAVCGLMNIWLAWPGGQAIASKSSFEFSTTTQYNETWFCRKKHVTSVRDHSWTSTICPLAGFSEATTLSQHSCFIKGIQHMYGVKMCKV